jgi:hypothetical protein
MQYNLNFSAAGLPDAIKFKLFEQFLFVSAVVDLRNLFYINRNHHEKDLSHFNPAGIWNSLYILPGLNRIHPRHCLPQCPNRMWSGYKWG